MKQKVIKIGSSIGVVIPKPIADEQGFKAGQEVSLKIEGKGFTVKPTSPQVKPAEKDVEFAAWLEGAIEQYRPALEALKNK